MDEVQEVSEICAGGISIGEKSRRVKEIESYWRRSKEKISDIEIGVRANEFIKRYEWRERSTECEIMRMRVLMGLSI